MQTEREKTATVADLAHRETTERPIAEIARILQETFSQRVTAHIAGVEDAKQVGRWARSQNAPRFDSECRLRTAYQVFTYIATCENEHIARAWMMGMNPQLDDDSPIVAIADERFKEVMAAARSFRCGDI